MSESKVTKEEMLALVVRQRHAADSWVTGSSREYAESRREIEIWDAIHRLIEKMDKGSRIDKRILKEIAEELRELSGCFNSREMRHPGSTVRWLEEKLRQ